MSDIVIYSDGGSRGNPGPGALGYQILVDGKQVIACGQYLGVTTNNNAEYEGVKTALKTVLERGDIPTTITCLLDSELVVKQINGKYKIKQLHLLKHVQEIQNTLDMLKKSGVKEIVFKHIPRAENKEADILVNKALDEASQNLI